MNVEAQLAGALWNITVSLASGILVTALACFRKRRSRSIPLVAPETHTIRAPILTMSP